jgi:transcriptional regulator with XRE-family HTH domain
MKSDREIRLADNLRRLMDSKNLTLTSVATQTGMNKSTLHNYCNGVIPRNLLKLKELADLLDVSLEELIFGEKSHRAAALSPSVGIEGRFEVIIRRLHE